MCLMVALLRDATHSSERINLLFFVQTIDRSGKPAFDVEYKGKRQIFTPVEVASSILKDLLKLG